jgi:two-component system, NtrC family, sensor histidine kinase AtoS
VLQYLRDRDFDMTNINLHDVVENSFLFIRPLISTKSIEFDNRVDCTVIKADYQQLQSVFKNLIQNSADAIEKEGRIEAWSERANGFIKVHFKDNGPGIGNPDKIFEPFYSTKSSGSGLGLTIAERIMKKHNGSLALSKSRKGETLFELKFPGMEYEQNSNN